MSDKNSPKSVINQFEKRQKMTPFFLGALAAVLALVGIFLIVMVVAKANPFSGLFATKTPTPTMTFTPSPVPTETATLTPTVGPTLTPTYSGPQQYQVQAGDNCVTIANNFGVDLELLLAMNNLDQNCSIIPGDIIIIPAQGQTMPTRTPIPTGMPRGTVINVTVQSGDTLQSLADEFDSTVTDIMAQNKLTTQIIYVGQVLKIRINLATRTPTLAPTSTAANLVTPLPTNTPTKAPTSTPLTTP